MKFCFSLSVFFCYNFLAIGLFRLWSPFPSLSFGKPIFLGEQENVSLAFPKVLPPIPFFTVVYA